MLTFLCARLLQYQHVMQLATWPKPEDLMAQARALAGRTSHRQDHSV